MQDILNYEKPEPNNYVSEDLDNYLLECKAYDGERIINEIGEFL